MAPLSWVNLDLKHQRQKTRASYTQVRPQGPKAPREGPMHAAAGHTGESTPQLQVSTYSLQSNYSPRLLQRNRPPELREPTAKAREGEEVEEPTRKPSRRTERCEYKRPILMRCCEEKRGLIIAKTTTRTLARTHTVSARTHTVSSRPLLVYPWATWGQ